MSNFIRGDNVTISDYCHIGDNVILEDDVHLDINVIIRDGVTIKRGSFIGANSIIGEYTADWYKNHTARLAGTIIGSNAVIRSGAVIYSDAHIEDNFQSGHNITIREHAVIGNNCSVGTLCDIQGFCNIGSYVRLHSNVHVGQKTTIKNYVWVFPYVIFTNDPAPPSDILLGVTVEEFAVIATGSVILPGIHIESDTLIAAGAVVTKDVASGSIVGGNPAKQISTIERIKHRVTGENVYPWRYHFENALPWEGIGYDKWLKNNC